MTFKNWSQVQNQLLKIHLKEKPNLDNSGENNNRAIKIVSGEILPTSA